MTLLLLRVSGVLQIEPSVLGTVTAQKTHREESFMGCSSIAPSFSILSMASQTLVLRWYGTDPGGMATGFIELSV